MGSTSSVEVPPERPLAPLRGGRRDPAELGVDLAHLAPLLAAHGPLAVVDLETTGLSSETGAEIIEFGAALLDTGAPWLVTLEVLLEPRGPLPRAVQRLTGLSAADLAGSPRIEEVAKADRKSVV